MTNYERIKTMRLDELADFLGFQMVGLLNPSTCEGCPAYPTCKDHNVTGYSCIDNVKGWLEYAEFGRAWSLTNACIIQHKTIDELAAFFGAIGHHIFDEENCCDCPAHKQCHEREADSCEQAFRFWLEDEAEDEDESMEESTAVSNEHVPPAVLLGVRFARGMEELMLEVIEPYMRGEQPTIDDEYLAAEIIKRYERGCACIFCPKSAVPDRSPDKDICTASDCAHGLAEYFNRMED